MAEELSNIKQRIESNKFPLSVVIVTCKEDEHFIESCLFSIPRGSEVIIAYTIPESRPDYESVQFPHFKLDVALGYVLSGIDVIELQIKYNGNDFNMAELRNIAKSYATRGLILSLDSDERISIPIEVIRELPQMAQQTEIGAFYVQTCSYGSQTPTGWDNHNQLRLFKNDKRINYRNRIHEQINTSLKECNYKLGRTPILINHLGYNIENKEQLIKKIARNNIGMFKDLAANPQDLYLTERLYTSLDVLKKLGEF